MKNIILVMLTFNSFFLYSQIQLGSDLVGNIGDRFGTSIGLTSSGNRLVVGSREIDEFSGQVKVFDLVNNSWVQIGGNIDGDLNGDRFGDCVSISNDGNRIAVSAPQSNDARGIVKVYQFQMNSW